MSWRSFRVLWSVFWILVRYRFAFLRLRWGMLASSIDNLHRTSAARMVRLFMEQRGLYIKVGQLISIFGAALPVAFREAFSALQDRVDPIDVNTIRKRLHEQWKRDPNEVLAEMENTPIAAASVGQVHRAVLHDGRRVAVKVQYPGIERIFHEDMKTLRLVVRLIGWFFPNPELIRIYEEMKTILQQEVDFSHELKNIERFRANFANNLLVTSPEPILEWCTPKVLVTQFVDGIKVDRIEVLRSAHLNPEEIARMLVDAYAKQFFEHGFYHADPHPGNILVLPGPQLCFVDFGACSVISESMREGMVSFVQAAVRKDTAGLVAAMRRMGFIPHSADPRVYDRVVAYFHDQFQEKIGIENLRLGNLRFTVEGTRRNLADLQDMNISLRDIAVSFHIPREWILLERTLLQIAGIVSHIAPDMDIMEAFLPHLRRFSILYGMDPSSLAMASMRELAKNLLALPAEVRAFVSRMTYGEIEFRWAHAEEWLQRTHAWVHECLFAGLGVFFLWASWHFEETGNAQRASLLLAAAAICGVLFLWNFWRAGRRKQ